MYNKKINFISNSATANTKYGQDRENTAYKLTVYDDSVEMEGAEWVQEIHPFEGTTVDDLVNDIISDMDERGFTAETVEKKAA